VTITKEPKSNFIWTLNEISKGSGDFKIALKKDDMKCQGIDMSGWVLTATTKDYYSNDKYSSEN
jgi:hypothetical protein